MHHHHAPREKVDFSFCNPVGVFLGHVPRIDPDLFFGRESELDAVEHILRPKEQGPSNDDLF